MRNGHRSGPVISLEGAGYTRAPRTIHTGDILLVFVLFARDEDRSQTQCRALSIGSSHATVQSDTKAHHEAHATRSTTNVYTGKVPRSRDLPKDRRPCLPSHAPLRSVRSCLILLTASSIGLSNSAFLSLSCNSAVERERTSGLALRKARNWSKESTFSPLSS